MIKFTSANTSRLLSGGTFVTSIFLTPVCVQGDCLNSFMLLLIGWLGTVVGGANLAWFSNLTLIGAWIAIGKNRIAALILAIFGVGLALLPFFIGKLAVDEAGTARTITSLEAGYWVWIGSMMIMVVASLIPNKKQTI